MAKKIEKKVSPKKVEKKVVKKEAPKKIIAKKVIKVEKVKKEEVKIPKIDTAILIWKIIGKNINLVVNKKTLTIVATKEEKELFKKKVDKYNGLANRNTPIALKLRNELIDFVQPKKLKEEKDLEDKKDSLKANKSAVKRSISKVEGRKYIVPKPQTKEVKELEKEVEKVVKLKKEEPKTQQGSTTQDYGRERYR